MKAIGCLMIIASTTLTGYYLSIVIRKRVKLFDELALFSENIASAIRYQGADLYYLIENENKQMNTPFTRKITAYLQQTKNIKESFRKVLQDISFSHGLSKEDKSVIIQFAVKLGTTDTEGQLNHCQYYQKVFSDKARRLREESMTKSKLYRSLGFFSGLAVTVVLV